MNPSRHPTIIALGFSEAGMLLLQKDAPQVNALISIHGSRECPLDAQIARRLDLDFDDIDAPDPADPLSQYRAILRERQDKENGLRRRPPTIEDAQAIIQFAQSIQNMDGLVLCHCGGGISRSPAAVLLCLATWTGEGNEPYCAQYLSKVRPTSVPHLGLIRFGDEVLGRNGRLVKILTQPPLI